MTRATVAWHRMRATGTAVVFLLLVVACGEDATEPTAKPEATSHSEEAASIVGEWSRTTTCADRVAALTQAGMAKNAAQSVVGDGFIPGVSDVSELEDPDRPCLGAESQVHSHFFTADGEFGSRDQHGNEVDSGSYELPSPGVLVIGDGEDAVTFDYVVKDGTLSLVPRLPGCAPRGCFLAEWAVAVSYLGLPWTAVSS